MKPANRILLKADPAAGIDWRGQLDAMTQALGLSIDACFAATESGELYCYLNTPGDVALIAGSLEKQARQILGDPESTASVIEPLIRCDGPARGHEPDFHYVVETNVDPVNEQGMNDWYDTEHLPGLAAVPGCIAAARYRNLTHTPRYIATYDLLSPEVVACPEWLAVRNTEWSSRVRPHFRNTKRTHFRRAFPMTETK